MKKETDILIIGAGAAGLRAACAACESGARILVVSKGGCASPEIMGFNAVVEPGDTAESFYRDLRAAGCEITNSALSRTLAETSVDEAAFLETLGLPFDRKADGSYHTLHTLGCEYPRLVHYQALTGGEELRLMRRYCLEHGVEFQTSVAITDLVVQDGVAAGAVGLHLPGNEFVEYGCRAVILASGGSGAIQRVSTYPKDCVGDGYAIACRAGAALVDLEFQQFEPCAFVYPEVLSGKIVPTTLLRSGAKLVNGQGHEFMGDYGLTRENARKGALSRAIASEILAGRGTPHGGIYYDMTMMPRETIVKGHSIFYEPAMAAGLDITQVPAEMAPAAHTYLGGVRIGADGATGIPGFFAAGEVTGGVHGADRIGGCAGAEVVVFGRQAGRGAAAYVRAGGGIDGGDTAPYRAKYEALRSRTSGVPVSQLRGQLADLMTRQVGILRQEEGLLQAQRTLSDLAAQYADAIGDGEKGLQLLYSFGNMLTLAEMQIQASLLRRESRGVFNRVDYPERDDAHWKKNLVFRLQDGQLTCTAEEPI